MNPMQTSAKVVLDSYHPETGDRVTTMEVVFHRFVLAEFNTHRMFSRNSASSRAIPVMTQIDRILANPALPLSYPAEQKGMQGGDELDPEKQERARKVILRMRNACAEGVTELHEIGLHKSVANRYIEPWMWHTVLVTAAEWSNFWHLRCSKMAQPEIRVAAELMREAYWASTPRKLHYGEWHMPFIFADQDGDLIRLAGSMDVIELQKQISAARCARVSYLTHDGQRRPDLDIQLFNRLKYPEGSPPHSSPMEHVCTPARLSEINDGMVRGNLSGWHQYRHLVEDEILNEWLADKLGKIA